jgi:hypothetical protein
VHAAVRLRFVYATDADLKQIANDLDWLSRLRNRASYDLISSPMFASVAEAHKACQRANNSLAVLDAIEADPAVWRPPAPRSARQGRLNHEFASQAERLIRYR